MKRPFLHRVCSLLILLAFLRLAGCGGTETGNPGPSKPGQDSEPSENAAVSLMDAICDRLTSCLEGVTETECRTSISVSTTLGAAFGVPSQDFAAYIDIVAAVDEGMLGADPGELSLCLSSLREVSCDDERLQAVEVAEPFIVNIEQMIPDQGCPAVFSESPP
ncbi:MAG: hypothetical protein AB1640_11850 [bacterium]